MGSDSEVLGVVVASESMVSPVATTPASLDSDTGELVLTDSSALRLETPEFGACWDVEGGLLESALVNGAGCSVSSCGASELSRTISDISAA